jgi:hypothetical protein
MTIAAVAAVLAMSGTAARINPGPNIVGLFVTVANSTGVKPLRYAVNDGREVRKVLGSSLRWVDTLTDREAGADKIVRAFANAAAKARKGEILWFHFSGHGVSHGESSYLVPHLRTASDLLNPKALVPIAQLRRIAAQHAKRGVRVVLVVDACHSGAARSNAVQRNIQQVFGLAPGVATLAATEVDRVAYELPGIENVYSGGVFTYFLVKGLAGHAAPGGRVTLQNLERYVVERVRRYTRNAARGMQVPVFLVHSGMSATVIQARGDAPATLDPVVFENAESVEPIPPGFVVHAEGAANPRAEEADRLKSRIVGMLIEAGAPISAQGLQLAETDAIRRKDAPKMAAIVDRRHARYLLALSTRATDVSSSNVALLDLQVTYSLIDGSRNQIVLEDDMVVRGSGLDRRQALNGAIHEMAGALFDHIGPFLAPE